MIAPLKLVTFEKELNEHATQGFRLEGITEGVVLTVLPAILSRQQPDGGMVKYEYKLLATREVATLQKELDGAASEGYEIRGIMSSGIPYIGSQMVLVLERLIGSKTPRFDYRILATKSDGGNKFIDDLQRFVSEGYRPIKIIHHLDIGLGVFVGAGKTTFLSILSRQAGASAMNTDEVEYKLLSTARNSTMEKEMNQLAGDGYYLSSSSLSNVLLMARGKKTVQPRYEYKLRKVKKNAEEKGLQEEAQQGFYYRAAYLGGAILERDQQANANTTNREYRAIRFPYKEKEKEKFDKEMAEAVTAGFRFLDLVNPERLTVLLIR